MSFFSALHGMLRRHTTGRKPLRQALRRSRRPWRLALECLEDRLCLSGNLFVNSFSTNSILDYDGTQGTFLQTFASGTAIGTPIGLAVGPNGDVFVSARSTNDVLRYDGNTGAFLGTFVSPGNGGLNAPDSLAFGPDGNLYVTSTGFNGGSGNYPSVLRYDGTTGAFLGGFVAPGSGGLSFPHGLTFGPDGNLYVTDVNNNDVLRYNGTTGAFMNAFVPPGSGGLNRATGLAFGTDGNLYVGSFSGNSVLRYDGKTGAFLGTFASGGGLTGPQGLQFGLDGNLYVSSFNNNQILRYNGTTGAAMGIFASGNTLGGPTYFAFRQTHTVTMVSSSVNPSVFGQSVTLTASVNNLGATVGSPTGTVTFTIDGVAQAAVPLSMVNGSEQATLSTAALSVGNHVVTAAYNSNDVGFAGSTSAALNEVVNRDGTAIAVSASADPTVYGQPVTFTAAVAAAAPGAGTLTGTITFIVDGTAQTPATVNNSQAGFTTSALGVGGHTITASYNGDGNFTSSGSGNFAQTVNRASTATTLVSSTDPSVFGQPVTLTVTVGAMAPGAGMPTGNVVFTIDSSVQAPVTLSSGQASFTSSTLGVGGHVITASYSGDGNFNASASAALNQGVNQANTTTAVGASVTPSVFGEALTFTAAVSAVAPGAGTPTGTVTFAIDGVAQPDVTLSSGQASVSTTALTVGSHTITATYHGDPDFFVSTSGSLSQTVDKADTTIAFGSSTDPSVFGQPVTFTAAVSAVTPGAGTPTGTVIFLIDGMAQSPAAVSNGQASFTTSSLSVGDHEISMDYSGDGSFNASTLDPMVTVTKATTTIGVAPSVAPSVFGQAVTLNATVAVVTPGAGAPSGTVMFVIDGVAQAPVALSNNHASFTTSTLGVGSHLITASFSGDNSFKSSTSAGLSQVVNKADTATAVSASADPSVFGQPVSFTATVAAVAPGAGMPSGSVTFTIDGVSQPVVNLNNGQAMFATSTLSVGSHTVAVAYDGDGNFNTSSSSLSQIVDKADTAIALSSSVAPSVFGQSVSFTAAVNAVSPGAGTLTGTFTFTVDGTAQTPVAVNNGQATFATSALGVGSHVITANYNGDADFNPSTSSVNQVVNEAATITALSSSTSPSVFGEAVTFTAAVAAVAPGSGTASGTVTFTIDGLAQPTVGLDNGEASLTTSTLSVGSHTIAVAYNGDGSFGSSTSTFSQAVNSADTATTLSASAAPSVFGQSVTFTAAVSAVAPGAGALTGMVAFAVDGTPQTPVALSSNGGTTFATSGLGIGTHVITASYSGDGNFNASSSATLDQQVSQAATTTAVSASVTPSVFGEAVAFTVTVSAAAPGAGMPTGTVSFVIDGTAQQPVALSNGQALFTTSTLAAGIRTITVAYNGDANFTGSTAGLSQTVNKADTAIAFGSSVDSSVFGQPVTFTAAVSALDPGAGTPTGTVIFWIDGVAQSPVSMSNGQASFTTSSLSVGDHEISMDYSGDGSFNASTLDPAVIVTKANTTISVNASVGQTVFGQAVTFTATVAVVAPGAGTPSGSLTFVVDGVAQAPVLLTNNQAAFTTSALAVGSHVVTATYGGDANFKSSTSAAFNEAVNKADTATAVSASVASSVFGQTVTLTAAVGPVAPGAGTPTGTVSLVIDGTAQTPIALNNGQAAFSTSMFGVGSHSIAVAYNGDGNFNGSSSARSQAVNKANTTVTLSSSAASPAFGQAVIFTAVVNPVAPGAGAPTGTVTFTIDGTAQAPVGLSNGQATLATSVLSVGSHTITATYSGDGSFNSGTSTLSQAVGKTDTTISFSVSAEPSVFGQPISFSAAVSAVISSTGTITGTVTFSVDGTAQTPAVVLSGRATFTISTLRVGSHEISMLYSGDANFNSSFLDPVQTVTKAGTTTTVAPAGPSVFGQPITLSAAVGTVAPGSGSPTGTVTFTIDGTAQAPVAVNNGQAALATASLAAGSHTVTAAYSGSDSFQGSTSSTFTVVVNKASTTTGLSSSANPSLAGQQVTFTATVSATTQGAGTPTGTVTFTIDGVAQPNVTLTSGQAAFSSTALTPGSHTVTVAYNGADNFNTSTSPTLTQAVNSVGGTIVLESSALQAVFGQPITFTATVNVAQPTGSVAFIVDGKVREAVTLKNGQATFTTSKLSVGNHSITARYNGGDSLSGTTSATVNETVSKAGTTTTLSSSAMSSVLGKTVRFTAFVAAVAPGEGTPAGKVTFFVDGVAHSPVAVHDGRAIFTVSTLGVGVHNVTASYSGDGDFRASSTSVALKETVGRAATRTQVHGSDDSSRFGQVVTFLATVRAADDDRGTPAGTVTFLVDGTVQATVDLVDGKARFTTSKLSVGKHVITVVYNGNANFGASTSSKFTHTVNGPRE